MYKLKQILLIFGVFLYFVQPPVSVRAQTVPPEPEDVINAINDWRSVEGLEILAMDTNLMTSAQAHADFQASINRYTYYSADKSDVTDRAVQAGFGDGGYVTCQEVLAFTSISTTLDTVVKTVWNNAKDRDLVLLNPELEYIGAGVSRKDASLFYTVDLCAVIKPAEETATAAALPPETATPEAESDVVEVVVATPGPDGSIYHQVEAGQAVWSIAIAYGTTINNIVSLNYLNPANPQIFAGQTLTIRQANTPTPTATLSPTPRPPTMTPTMTSTEAVTSTPTITPTPTKKPLIPGISKFQSEENRPFGYLLVAISTAGILLVIFSVLRSRRD